MLPVILSPEYIKALVIGEGPATTKRLEMLKTAGVQNIKYIKSYPSESDFNDVNFVFIADFDDVESEKIFKMANAKNILVNIEDKTKFCNFHTPAMVRRGHLLLTVSTNAKAPRLARRIRKILANMFDESWEEKTDHLARARDEYKKQGYKFDSMAEKLDEVIRKEKLFKKIPKKFLK